MKAIQVFAKDCARPDGRPPCEHLLLVTDTGQLFERFSDDLPGVWAEIPLPVEQIDNIKEP